ncbi:MAG: glycosyltransferase [Desulfobacterales bacterium]|nr:glycosyltransferase [Desulfobacterales bacterium]
MTEKKGLPTVYRALKLLAERQVAFHHTLIGDGDDREQIISLIDELNLKDCCSWLGTRTHGEVLEHFRESDLFVLGCEIAKNGDRDGIPNVLVESLAMGVPAVSTNVSSLPEILINEKTGLTVEPQDSHSFAQAIDLLLTDASLRKSLIEAGQQFVRSDFDNEKQIARLAELFRSANPLLQNPVAHNA